MIHDKNSESTEKPILSKLKNASLDEQQTILSKFLKKF